MELWRRKAIVIIGLIEALALSGCIFGWVSLIHVLQQDRVYSHLCEEAEPISQYREVLADDDNKLLLYSTVSQYEEKSQDDNTTSIIESLQLSLENVNETQVDHTFKICSGQSNALALVYTIAAVNYGLTSVFIGFALDHWGLWVTRFIGSGMVILGFLCLAFTSQETPWLLWPAMNLLALGSNQLRFSSFQFANLWPKQRTTVLISYSAGYSISTTLFLLVQYMYAGGMSLRAIGLLLAFLSCFTVPATLLMPRMKIEDHVSSKGENNKEKGVERVLLRKLDEEKEGKGVTGAMKDSTEFVLDEEDQNPTPVYKDTTVKSKQVPLSTSLYTVSSFLHVYWQFINFFLVLFYSASFNSWLYKITDDQDEVAFFNGITGLCSIIAPLFIPLAGLFTDWQIKRASKQKDPVIELAEKIKATANTVMLATGFMLLTMICKMFTTRGAVYFSLIFIAISRPFVVGSCTSYIQMRFHPDHFNRLMGIFMSIVAVLCLGQFPVFLWMFSSDQNFKNAHWLLITALILSLISPLHVMIGPWGRKYATTEISLRENKSERVVRKSSII